MKHSNIAFFIPHNGCPHTCSFCNQKTISGSQSQVSPSEIAKTCEKALSEIAEPQNTEIAFFGGSFTAIERGYMISLLEAAYPYTKHFSGIRISTRPDAIDTEILDILKRYNVTSIELGVQSLDDTVLQANKRGHTAEDVYRATALIKEYRLFLGLQMMVGLYKDTKKSIYFTSDEFVRLNPDTVRIYPTVVLKGTELHELYKQGKYKEISIEESVIICADLLDIFDKNNIKVIRVGLHASDNVETERVAGVYHPAFRELCEAERFYRVMNTQLQKHPKGNYKILVPKKCLSKAIGQKRHNVDELIKSGYNVTLEEDESLSGIEIKLL